MFLSDFSDLPGQDILDDGDGGADDARPRTRGDCADQPRPCPYVTCKHHLLTEISSDGRLFFNGNADGSSIDAAVDSLESMPETCALDVADGGGFSAGQVAEYLGVSERWMLKTQAEAITKIRTSPDVVQLRKAATRR